MMRGLNFQIQKPVVTNSPNRMDIACFVGLIELREDPPRDDINQWLFQQSWRNLAKGFSATFHRVSAEQLLDIPVPIESWERFSQLFNWDQRQFTADITGAGYLAMAVHSFFAQGGRKCYVVRVDDPLPLAATATQREAKIGKLLPGYDGSTSSNPNDRKTWHGVGHLLGLPDVTTLAVPDLPDLLRSEIIAIDTDISTPAGPDEQFVVCSDPVAAPPQDKAVTRLPAPACDDSGYDQWTKVIHQLAEFISRYRRDVQLVAAIPLPASSGETTPNLMALMESQNWLKGSMESSDNFIASAFVQLCYPWLRSAGSELLPQRLEPPDGVLTGMLARNALTRGAYRSVNGIRQNSVSAVHPTLSREEIYGLYPQALPPEFVTDGLSEKEFAAAFNRLSRAALIDRVSLFGQSIDSISLLSDVTTSNFSAHRPANVNRIITMIVRSAQIAGEEYAFDSNGEGLWAQITRRLNDVLRILFDLGALRGKQPEDAYLVRCNRSTMSQLDLDSGRVIAEIHFEPAASIESIDVILAMQQNGIVSFDTIGRSQAVA